MFNLIKIVFSRMARKDTCLKDLSFRSNTKSWIVSKDCPKFSFLRRRKPIQIKSGFDKIFQLRLDNITDSFSDFLPILLPGLYFQIDRNFNDCLHKQKLNLIKQKEKYAESFCKEFSENIPKERTESQRIPRNITSWEKNMNLIHSLC